MIELKPYIEYEHACPHCGANLTARDILWQGIHVCVTADCTGCGATLVCDLAVGQALYTPYIADLATSQLFGDRDQRHWFGEQFFESLQHPDHDTTITLEVEKTGSHTEVIILNCIDYLYGHSLLKLLNAAAHLKNNPEFGLVIIVPRFLRWLIPQGVAEVWVVDVPLSSARRYYLQLDHLIKAECVRFDRIFLSLAVSHPSTFNITHFSGIERHDFSRTQFHITFVWREDRPWCAQKLCVRVGKHLLSVKRLLLMWQNFRIIRLFRELRRRFPEASFTVAGLGTTTTFPDWVNDCRVAAFDDSVERRLCQIYRDSRLVIGVHGSNMLLPSAHAGLTIDLMPDDRWPNIAQDLLFQEADCRMASYRYRYVPLDSSLNTLASIAASQIESYETFMVQMSARVHSSKGNG